MFKRIIILTGILVVYCLCAFTAEKNPSLNMFYLYSTDCKYCTRSAPNIENAAKKNHIKLVKQNVYTQEGQATAFKFGINYVPFVVLVNNNTGYALELPVSCLLEKSCVNKQVAKFISNNK